jgi:hypothetical protein
VNLDDVLNTKAFDWEKASNAAGAYRVVCVVCVSCVNETKHSPMSIGRLG